MQPTFTQVPPWFGRFSTTAVFSPSCAALMAQTYPPGPVPITTTSYCSAMDSPPVLAGVSPPAGYIEDCTGRVGCRVGQQKHHRPGVLFRRCRPLHGNERSELAHSVRLSARGMDVRVGDAGADRIHANAFLGHFARKPHREGVDGALGGSIVDIFPGRPQHRRYG